MEAKGENGAEKEKAFKTAESDEGSDNEMDAPAPKVVALRQGYNQTYIIRSSKSNIHEVLFRCGNWCYSGRVDLGNAGLELSDLPVVIPALQKQQGSLQYLCEWKEMPNTNPYTNPLETLYDAFDFIGNELASERIERKLMKAAQEYQWIDEDSDSKNFFELQSGGYDCFDGIDMVASKTFVRGLILLVIYYQRSFFIILQEGDGEQPLLDVRFPDLSAHMQGIHLQTYREEDCTNMKKLTLWQAAKNIKTLSPPKPVKVQCKDVSGTGYNQTFLIRRTRSSENGNNLREVLFRFGNWCYNGHVDLGPKLDLPDIPIIIPMLRRQQSALTFMCEVTKMPATSLFTPSMEHLAEAIPAIQQELSKAEHFIQSIARNGGSLGDNAYRIVEWLEDDNIECFFEIGIDKCEALKDVEAIASKIHIGGVVLVMLYFEFTFYVYLENGEDEQALLDTNFPDVSYQKEGIQIKTYRDGVEGCKELRRISLWKVINEFADETENDKELVPETVSHSPQKKFGLVAATTAEEISAKADAKQNDTRREEDVKPQEVNSLTSSTEAKIKKSLDSPVRKTNHPHHIAPLKSSASPALKKLQETNLSSGMKAPWDESGRPLGLKLSK